METLDLDKKGYYIVGWKKFYTKAEAIAYATENSFEVRWIFNDQLCKNLNWSAIIESSLEDLYKKRVLQLSDKETVTVIINEPKIHFDGYNYYCYFTDTYFSNLDDPSVELFYCVHSSPELIIKHVQLIKEACIQDSNLKQNSIKNFQDNWSATTYNKFYKI